MRQLEPLWHAPRNQDPEYPNRLASSGKMPVIGEGVLVRVDLVYHDGTALILSDPFTGQVHRKATDEEAKKIGTHTSVMECYGKLADHQIALTFDDGPSDKYTPKLLEILKRESVPATFFMLGEQVLAHPKIAQRVASDGHMIGGHTLTHIDFDDHGTYRNRQEVLATQRIIRDIAGVDTRTYRLPYTTEEENVRGILTAQQLGQQEVGFDLDTADWEYGAGSDEIPLPKLDGAGRVVVMHDGGNNREQTLALVEKLIHEAKAKGYTFVTIAPLLTPEYLPKSIDPTMDDRVTTLFLQIVLADWEPILHAVMLYTTIATTGLMVLYAGMAWLRSRRLQTKAAPAGSVTYAVSILIPAYNEAAVIRDTLDNLRSVLAAYPNDAEVIVLPNNCKDNTQQIAEAYAMTWPQLRVIPSASGKHSALNAGIGAARHDVIVMIDADTRLQADTLAHLTRHFADKAIGGVAGHVKVGNRKGLLPLFQKTEYLWGICIDRLALGVLVAPGACTAWWKTALLETGGVHGDTKAEDFDLTLRFKARDAKERRRVIQDVLAVAWTEAPSTLGDLWGQRVRWMYGTLQAFWKNKHMVLRWRYGWQGMVLMPYTVLSLVLAMIFLPLALGMAVMAVAGGSWQGILWFVGFAAAVNFVSVLTATRIAKEDWRHLLIVPVYRLIDAPLRMCVLFATIFKVVKGRDAKWFSAERKNDIAVELTA